MVAVQPVDEHEESRDAAEQGCAPEHARTAVGAQQRRGEDDAGKRGGEKLAIDGAYVDAKLGELAKNEDLSRYVL